MKIFLRFFFKLLYHQLAFAYDLVAGAVSFGQWKNWIMSVIPFIEGTRILEIGHGPGHLQRVLLTLPPGSHRPDVFSGGQARQLSVAGIDESAQMGWLAKRNTDDSARLTRGLAQSLPFKSESFDTVISTFPAEYITHPQTLAEVRRCLSDRGRFIILPAAWPRNPFLDWLFRVTGESPSEAMELVKSKFKKPFVDAGFETEIRTLDAGSSILLIVIANP